MDSGVVGLETGWIQTPAVLIIKDKHDHFPLYLVCSIISRKAAKKSLPSEMMGKKFYNFYLVAKLSTILISSRLCEKKTIDP